MGNGLKRYETAVRRLATSMISNPSARHGDVILTADYYEPFIIFEAKRK